MYSLPLPSSGLPVTNKWIIMLQVLIIEAFMA